MLRIGLFLIHFHYTAPPDPEINIAHKNLRVELINSKLKKTHFSNKNTVHLFSLSAPQDPKMGRSIKERGFPFRDVSNLV